MTEKVRVTDKVTFQLCTNPNCGSLHISFYDEAGKRFAVGSIAKEDISNVIRELQALAPRSVFPMRVV